MSAVLAPDVGRLTGDPGAAVARPSWRRERAIQVTLALAETGGWDAVVMDTVSELCGSALGTLYKEFPSKANLLVASADALVAEALERRRARVDGEAPADSAARLVGMLVASALTRPVLTEAVLRAALTCDPTVAAEVTRLRRRLIAGLAGPLPGEPAGHQEVCLGFLVDVLFAQLLATVQGRQTRECMERVLAAAITRLGGWAAQDPATAG